MQAIDNALDWYLAAGASKPIKEICPTRDLFQARLDACYGEIVARKLLMEDEVSLFAAVCGEIGNNCFDHNLGQWHDAVGCWFSPLLDIQPDAIFSLIADRGQGVLSSLKRVQPDLVSEEEALKIAFERKLSGRSPERRGNGLKFVRSVINGSAGRGLLFFSGKTGIQFGKYPSLEKCLNKSKMEKKGGTGTLALIAWRR